MWDLSKEIKYSHEARQALLEGVEKLTNAVAVTMGPKGETVVIEKLDSSLPIITKDGVTVAKAVSLSDPFENMGAQIVKDASNRTAEEAGDGTTTVTVMSHAICKEGVRMIASGYSQVDINKGITIARNVALSTLANLAKPVSSSKDLVHIATVSANGEEKIGKLIAESIKKVGKDGVVTVEEAKGFETSLDIAEGAEYNAGYLSPYFVNNTQKNSASFDKPVCFITDQEIESLKTLMPILEKVCSESKSLLIIAPKVSGDLLQGLVLNASKGLLKVCAVNAPGVGDYRHDLLSDIAALMNTQVFSDLRDQVVKSIQLCDLGTCKKVNVTRKKMTFVSDQVDKQEIEDRINSIKSKLKDPRLTDNEINLYKKRLSKLDGGVAILRVGGSTQVEILERKDRVDDALNATWAATEEGIVPGGGSTLIKIYESLEKYQSSSKIKEGVLAGFEVFKRACKAPLFQICTNAGKVPEIVFENLINSGDTSYGYDARKDMYVNMLDAGIVDPAKVTRLAIENAVSSAQALLSVGCAMINESIDSNKG